MIFNNNTTSLGSSRIPMAEGYDGSVGAALALIESARNDYAMFRAMLDVDARELQIRRESAGYVAESEITALAEAASGGIWAKIKELFSKLIAKIKSIFHVFMSKISSLWMTDRQLVKKYEKELYRKRNIDKLEVKFTKYNSNFSSIGDVTKEFTNSFDIEKTAAQNGWVKDKELEDREEYFLGFHPDDLDDKLEEKYITDSRDDTYELGEIGGIRSICSFLNDYSKNMSSLNRCITTTNRALERNVKNADRKAKEKAGQYGKKEIEKSAMEEANNNYDMAIAYQSALLKVIQWILIEKKNEYKQNKAVFMKAIAVNEKKLEATSIYAEAVAEAAAEEVEDVISGALSQEELSKICNAPLHVKDCDVSDDPDELTYGPNSYTSNMSYVRTDGCVDTDINSKSESTYFGQLLY